MITDIKLFKFFLNNLEKVNFLKRKDFKSEIKKILKDIIKYLELISSMNQTGNKINIIPLDEMIKNKNIHKLWELLLKEAIYCLREEDEVDTNEFKEDFGITEIVKYFKDYSDFEELLYGSDIFYRDHTFHIIRVFLLGYKLLNSNDKVGDTRSINFSNIKIVTELDLKEIKIDINEREAIWAVISLTHDLGYPIEKIDKINQKIKKIIRYYGSAGIEDIKFQHPIQNLSINHFLLTFISSKIIFEKNQYHTVIQNKYYLKFSIAFENFKHGIMSSLLLLKYFTYFKESEYSHSTLRGLSKERAKQFLIRKLILRSIASHDNEDIYHFFPDTFSFLLALIDDLQEWDRASKSSVFKFTEGIRVIEFNKTNISFEIIYKPFRTSDFIDQIINSFSRNAKRYIRLFRSAPDSDKRNFIFNFKIKIKQDNLEKTLIEFEYIPKLTPTIKIPSISENQDYLNIFHEFIENDFILTEEIKDIISTLKSKINEASNS